MTTKPTTKRFLVGDETVTLTQLEGGIWQEVGGARRVASVYQREDGKHYFSRWWGLPRVPVPKGGLWKNWEVK